jgi:hypothetical protein
MLPASTGTETVRLVLLLVLVALLALLPLVLATSTRFPATVDGLRDRARWAALAFTRDGREWRRSRIDYEHVLAYARAGVTHDQWQDWWPYRQQRTTVGDAAGLAAAIRVGLTPQQALEGHRLLALRDIAELHRRGVSPSCTTAIIDALAASAPTGAVAVHSVMGLADAVAPNGGMVPGGGQALLGWARSGLLPFTIGTVTDHMMAYRAVTYRWAGAVDPLVAPVYAAAGFTVADATAHHREHGDDPDAMAQVTVLAGLRAGTS